MQYDLIVTRHEGLVDYLFAEGIIDRDDAPKVVAHATAKEVRGLRVIGVMPIGLAAECLSITEIPLALTPEMRGKELSEEEVRAVALPPRTYCVVEVVED